MRDLLPIAIGSNTFTWLGLAALIADVLALASVWRSRVHGRQAKIVWVALITLLPFLGAVSWFALGRERRKVHEG